MGARSCASFGALRSLKSSWLVEGTRGSHRQVHRRRRFAGAAVSLSSNRSCRLTALAHQASPDGEAGAGRLAFPKVEPGGNSGAIWASVAKTAWYMARRLRSALIESNMDKLGGIVEIDEGFIARCQAFIGIAPGKSDLREPN
jgi:hypothetical protein